MKIPKHSIAAAVIAAIKESDAKIVSVEARKGGHIAIHVKRPDWPAPRYFVTTANKTEARGVLNALSEVRRFLSGDGIGRR